MRNCVLFVFALTLLGAAGSLSPAAAQLSPYDQDFLDFAAESALAEIQLGVIAENKGAHLRVRMYGQQMQAAHSLQLADLKRLAEREGYDLPLTIGDHAQEHIDEIAGHNGEAFDEAYIMHMTEDHAHALRRFIEAARGDAHPNAVQVALPPSGADDPNVRAFAARYIPALASHLSQAYALGVRMGILKGPRPVAQGAGHGGVTLRASSYPNPFNPVATISFELPADAHVAVKVYDLTGRHLATLFDGEASEGVHEVQFDASHLATGTYLYRIETAQEVLTGRMSLVK